MINHCIMNCLMNFTNYGFQTSEVSLHNYELCKVMVNICYLFLLFQLYYCNNYLYGPPNKKETVKSLFLNVVLFNSSDSYCSLNTAMLLYYPDCIILPPYNLTPMVINIVCCLLWMHTWFFPCLFFDILSA